MYSMYTVRTYVNVSQAHKEGLQELEQLERQYRSSRQQKVTEMPVSDNIAFSVFSDIICFFSYTVWSTYICIYTYVRT